MNTKNIFPTILLFAICSIMLSCSDNENIDIKTDPLIGKWIYNKSKSVSIVETNNDKITELIKYDLSMENRVKTIIIGSDPPINKEFHRYNDYDEFIAFYERNEYCTSFFLDNSKILWLSFSILNQLFPYSSDGYNLRLTTYSHPGMNEKITTAQYSILGDTLTIIYELKTDYDKDKIAKLLSSKNNYDIDTSSVDIYKVIDKKIYNKFYE